MNRTEYKSNCLWLSRIPGVEAWASEWLNDPHPLHAHDFYQVSLTRRGAGLIRVNGHSAACPVGHCVVFRPEEVHRIEPASGETWEFDTLYVPVRRVAEAVEGRTGTKLIRHSSQTPILDDELLASFSTLHGAIVRGENQLTQDECLLSLLGRLVTHLQVAPHFPKREPNRTGLRRAKDYLDGQVEVGITLAQLAAVAGVGECHLVRSFRQQYGLPPHAYHVQVRVNRARKLLREGMTVADVALRTGFADQAHLTRHFKKLVGVTPGHFRLRSISFKTGGSVGGHNDDDNPERTNGDGRWTQSGNGK